MSNWAVHIYDGNQLLISWPIHDRTESQAEKEALNDPRMKEHEDKPDFDWTLTKI